jgi:hypothetical protein
VATVGGLGIHRRQTTYDWIGTDTGEARRGQLRPATRLELRPRLARCARQQAHFALEGHHRPAVRRRGAHGRRVPRPSGQAGRHPGAARPQRRAKTDRTGAHHLRELLRGRPPAHLADQGTQVRLRRALVGERTGGWSQRIHAVLFHHGLAERSRLLTADGRPGWPGPSCLRWPARRSAPVAWTSPSPGPTASAPVGHLARQGAPVLRWALHGRPPAPPAPPPRPRRRPPGQAAPRRQAGGAVGGPQAGPRASHRLRGLGAQALVPAAA